MTGQGAGAASSPLTLPPLQRWSGSDWPAYETQTYQIFNRDFIAQTAHWRGQRVTVQREPLLNGKEEGFWHLVTETGPSGLPYDRVPDLERCARIAWVRAILTAPAGQVRTFGQMRGSYQHYGVALPDFSYIVFLRQWPANVQLKSAYHITSTYKREHYRQQWVADTR